MSQAFKLYDHIDNLPMNIFIDCICDQFFKKLIIEGEPSEDQLLEAWDIIFYQYIDANQDNEAVYILELKKDIALLEHKIKLIECTVANLIIVFSQKLLDALKSLGVRINGIEPDKDDYQLRLKKILLTLGPKRFQLQEMMNELLAYEKYSDKKKIDRQFFKTIFVRLSKFQRYPVRAHEIVVSEYVALLKEYIASNSSQQKMLQDGEEG